jgi:hypothetical protein
LANRDRGRPRGLPLPHHRAYGSVHGGSADYANACSRRRGGRRGLELCIGEEASIPASPRRWASPFRLAHRPEIPVFCRMAPSRCTYLLSASTVQAFGGLLRLLCPLLTSPPRSRALRPAQSGLPDTAEISRGKTDRLRRTPAGFTTPTFDGRGLRDHMLARPAG